MEGLLLLGLLTATCVLGALVYRMRRKRSRRRRGRKQRSEWNRSEAHGRGRQRVAEDRGDERAKSVWTEGQAQAVGAPARSDEKARSAANHSGTDLHQSKTGEEQKAPSGSGQEHARTHSDAEAQASRIANQNASKGQPDAHDPPPDSKDAAAAARRSREASGNAKQEKAQQTEPEDEHAEAEAAASNPGGKEIAVESGDGSSPTDVTGDHTASRASRDQLRGAGDATESPDTAAVVRKLAGETANEGSESGASVDKAGDENSQRTGAASCGNSHKEVARSRPAAGTQRPPRPAIYQDARGGRRRPARATERPPPPERTGRSPAEAKLRLRIHPIQRRASLSVVLARPEGYPESVTVHIDGGQTAINAYDEHRYDDLDPTWTTELLDSELRVASSEGFHWVRSVRQLHIFTEDQSESGLISVGTVRAGATHTIVCRSADAEAVQNAATATGSPPPTADAKLQDVPEGWMLLTGYAPVHTATPQLPAGLQPLDPGTDVKIEFEDGLAVQNRAFAEGYPPRITISPEPSGASVTIGGQPATLAAGRGWVAPGWDAPGHHMVDVTPGPSAKYEIVADPWISQSWKFWNGHPGRFCEHMEDTWGEVEICGASIQGPEGQAVIAARADTILVALGARGGIARLRRRKGMEISMGLVAEPPAFLLSARGQRRAQGRVIWLGLAPSTAKPKGDDPAWREAIRWAAARRLRLEGGGPCAEEAWRKAKQYARRHRKARK